jgi:bifunctional non-homologous end joining protein LigD
LRQPTFLRMRDDKRPVDCSLQIARKSVSAPAADASPTTPTATAPAVSSSSAAEPASPVVEPAPHKIAFSNLDKVFWPEDGYTKGDLIDYYRAIAPFILVYLRDRPLVMTRFPDGIYGKSFFQQDAPVFVPGWIRTERMWSDSGGREKDYIVCDDLETLLYIANLGTIPLHIWSSRVSDLGRPDFCILDLDPKSAPFAHVIEVARRIHSLCDELDLPAFPKTSGQAGMHVLIPLGRQLTHEQSKLLGQLLARVIEQELPDIATTARVIADRGGRVYVDFLQNGHGKTLVSPFCVRPQPGATVSTTLRWKEVDKRLDPKRFTIKTVPARMKKLGEDPVAPLLELKPDLGKALERLGAKLSRPRTV